MSDPNNSAPSDKPAETAAPETSTQSLEQIASEFSVEDQANKFTASPEQPSTPQPHTAPQPIVPDPITDPDGYKSYMVQHTQQSNRLQGALQTLSQRLESYERQQMQSKVDVDIAKAVAKVNEKLKVEPLLAEIALEKFYRSDASFKRIWDNRDRNPQAFEKALDVVAQKLAPTFAVRQDPQLTENLRAAKASTRTMASTAKADYDPRLKGLYEPESQGEFDQTWEAFKRGMIPS